MFSKSDFFAATDHHGVFDFDGLPDMDALTALITEVMLDDLNLDADIPYNPTLAKNAKWRVVSALQKAIRRGDVDNALRCAIALHNGGEDFYMWRRLSVVCLEDVGLANLPLAALVLTLAGAGKWRKANGGLHITCYVVEALTKSVKDRAVCDTCYTTFANPDNETLKTELIADYDLSEQLARYWDKELTIEQRLIAGWAVTSGLHSGDGKTRKTSANNKEAFKQMMADSDYPSIVKLVSIAGLTGGAEGLNIAMPLVYEIAMTQLDDMTTNEATLPPCELIGGLPSAGYDAHTMEGKRAYAYLSKSCKPVAEWLASVGNPNPVPVIGSAVFGVEGCILKTHLVYPYQSYARGRMYEIDAIRWGVSGDQFLDLMERIAANPDDLMYARKRIVVGKS